MLVAEVFPASNLTNQLLRVVRGTMRYQVHSFCRHMLWCLPSEESVCISEATVSSRDYLCHDLLIVTTNSRTWLGA